MTSRLAKDSRSFADLAVDCGRDEDSQVNDIGSGTAMSPVVGVRRAVLLALLHEL